MVKKLNDQKLQQVNQVRAKWKASSIDEIAQKATFLAKRNLPFIFTGVRKSVVNLNEAMDESTALAQYKAFTMNMEKYTGH